MSSAPHLCLAPKSPHFSPADLAHLPHFIPAPTPWHYWIVCTATSQVSTRSTRHTMTRWPFENSDLWRVACHSGWWDWLHGIFIWLINGDNLLRRRQPSVSNLKWICNYKLKFSALLWCLQHILGTEQISGCCITWINSLSSTLAWWWPAIARGRYRVVV